VVQLEFAPGDPYGGVSAAAYVLFDNASGGHQDVTMYGFTTPSSARTTGTRPGSPGGWGPRLQ
jgi:hypothetical protein